MSNRLGHKVTTGLLITGVALVFEGLREKNVQMASIGGVLIGTGLGLYLNTEENSVIALEQEYMGSPIRKDKFLSRVSLPAATPT